MDADYCCLSCGLRRFTWRGLDSRWVFCSEVYVELSLHLLIMVCVGRGGMGMEMGIAIREEIRGCEGGYWILIFCSLYIEIVASNERHVTVS